MSLGACATWVQDAASRRAGLQNGNPRDYCTYKRFTVRGPFAEPKGDRGRYGNRQAEASTYPFYFPRCKPSAPPSLFASSDSVAPFYSLHLGTLSPLPLFFPLFPRTFPLCFFAVVARRLFSLALQILKRRREPLRSMIPSVVVLSATEFSMNKRTNNIRVRYRSPIYRVCFSHFIFESTYAIVVYIKIRNVFLCHAERRPNIFVMRTYRSGFYRLHAPSRWKIIIL